MGTAKYTGRVYRSNAAKTSRFCGKPAHGKIPHGTVVRVKDYDNRERNAKREVISGGR